MIIPALYPITKSLINYRNEMIAAVPLKIEITPQDWFRFAKDSSNVKEQIEYLKKAIEMNKNDISVRKVLAGVYLQHGRLDEAISQYKDVLSIKSDDSQAMEELAKCYIKKNEFDEAIKVSKEVIKNNPKECSGLCSSWSFSWRKKDYGLRQHKITTKRCGLNRMIIW